MNRPSARRLPLPAALLLGLTLTACADPVDDPAPGERQGEGTAAEGTELHLGPDQDRVTTEAVEEIAALLPEEIRERGTLEIINTAGSVPPLNFYATDDRTLIGIETDIASLVADVLGLEARYNVAEWANVFVGLDSGRYDVGFANITVTEERKDKYDFATYRLDNISFEAVRDSGWTVDGPPDVAGRTIGVSSGTNQEELLVNWNEENTAAGLEATDIKYFQNSSDYYLALSSGRIDAYLGPNPTARHHAAVTGETEVVGSFSGAGDDLQGEIAATTKKDNGLITAVSEALNETIENGSYLHVLERWGLADEAVESSLINPPGLPRTDP